jgi:hypothetical protein
MRTHHSPNDVTDEQWPLIEPPLPPLRLFAAQIRLNMGEDPVPRLLRGGIEILAIVP